MKKQKTKLTPKQIAQLLLLAKYEPKINYKKLAKEYYKSGGDQTWKWSSKSKKGHKIIEAEMLYREGKENLRRLVVLLILSGFILIGVGLWLKFTT